MIQRPPFPVRPWNLLGALGFCAAAVSLAGFLGTWTWWLEILSHFRAQYAAGFLLLAGLFALGRRWRGASGALAMALVNALPIALFLLPPAPPPPAASAPVRAMLLNVNSSRGDPVRVAAAVAAANPDLLVLEEINVRWLRELAPVLDAYPFQKTVPRFDNFGIGLFSRLPFGSVAVEPFGDFDVPSIFAEIAVEGRPLFLVATHPMPPGNALLAAERNRQLEWIARKTAALPHPVLLLGDLNVSPWSPYYRRLLETSRLRDSAQGRSIRPTWPAPLPPLWIQLDHALHTPELAVLSRSVGPDVGSDHYPLLLDFAWPVDP